MQHGGMMRGCGRQLGAITGPYPGVQGVGVRGSTHWGRGKGAGALHVPGVRAHIGALEPLPPPQEAPVVEHVLGCGV